MAAGRAVVAARAGALPEIVGEAGLLVDGDDVETWAAAIESLLDDSRRREELAQLGRARAARFRWSEVARATRSIYDQVLSAGRQVPR
jgi:glycosyltransferase involved in cell wall biosynthesis